MKAFCFRSGEIGFGEGTPEGALELCQSSHEELLKCIVEVNARHAKGSEILLVPGIPEAATDDIALDACIQFRELLIDKLMNA